MKSKINLILLAIIFSVMLMGSTSAVYDDWDYKKPVNVTENSGSSLTDYQVLLTVDTASLISEGKMQADCDDIRFTDSDESTELPYWLESGCNTASTKVWVKVPSLTPSSTRIIYIYYGNTNAASAGNGSNTFEFFDDFDDGSISDWTETGSGTINEVSTTRSVSGSYSLHHKYISAYGTVYKSIPSQTSTFIAEWNQLHYAANSGLCFGDGTMYNTYNGAWICTYSATGKLLYYSDAGDQNLLSYDLDTWYSIKAIINPVSQNIKIYADDSVVLYEGDMRGSVTTFDKVNVPVYTAGYDTYFDNIRIRKYASTEPTYTICSEHSNLIYSVKTEISICH